MQRRSFCRFNLSTLVFIHLVVAVLLFLNVRTTTNVFFRSDSKEIDWQPSKLTGRGWPHAIYFREEPLPMTLKDSEFHDAQQRGFIVVNDEKLPFKWGQHYWYVDDSFARASTTALITSSGIWMVVALDAAFALLIVVIAGMLFQHAANSQFHRWYTIKE